MKEKEGYFKKWRRDLSSHKKQIFLFLFLLLVAITLNVVAGNYVDKVRSNSVSDIILDHIPPIDLSFIFIYGYLIVIAIIFLYPLFFKTKQFSRVVSQFSLLVLIRSFFISLTHLGMPADKILGNWPRFYDFMVFRNDLFFSGHTAVTFLGYLLFRKDKFFGKFFLIATIVMAATALLVHAHYSIDVFAALFIAYGSYKIGELVFKKIKE